MAACPSATSDESKFYAHVDYEDQYVQPLLLNALEARLSPGSYTLVESLSEVRDKPILQIVQYENIAFELALQKPESVLINSYVIRKALIRKHYLNDSVSRWIVKYPSSVLKDHVKMAVELEVDYVEYLDEALLEAYELRESMSLNAELPPDERMWWILKPSMADRGNGIRLFSTEEELTAIFEEWEANEEDEEEEDDDNSQTEHVKVDAEDHGKTETTDTDIATSNNVYASQLRHFVAQQYVHPPLLLESAESRKFHIRTYVLAIGGLRVYVYKPMLALFAAAKYAPPWVHIDLDAHLTNTCVQGTDARGGSVRAFWDLEDQVTDLPMDWKKKVFQQICSTTGELFEAAARNSMVNFQVLPNSFELFGLDYLVDEKGVTWLLEVNAFPDFKQTGESLQELIQGLFGETISLAVLPFFIPETASYDSESMAKVLDIDLGRK